MALTGFLTAGGFGPPASPAGAATLATSGNSHFVSPNGSPSGNGTMNHPWDLQTALNQPATVKPGDTLWMRNGVYGNGNTTFTSNLNGKSSEPIILRQYPGERATVNGGFTVSGSYVWFWGFEVANLSVTNRITSCGGTNCNMMPVGLQIYAPGSKFINMVVHDTAQGFSEWLPATDSEIYGSLIYNNGWQGSDRGHGHGIYTQNQTGTKTIRDNIIFQGFGLGIQAYGSSSAYVQNYFLDGNTFFNSGTLSNTGHHDYNVLFAGGHRPQNITIQNTYTYSTPGDNAGMSALDWPASDHASNLVSKNNYWIGGNPAIQVYNWQGATFTNNTAYSQGEYVMLAGKLTAGTYNWDNNHYFGRDLFELDARNQNFAGWQASTGLDRHSSFAAGAPTGTWTFLRPNLYESGRANITIYNWNSASTVSVDVSSILAVGQHFELRNAQDFYGTPVLSGTYRGGSLSIPMTGLTVARPIGIVPTEPKPAGPGFGAFVLLTIPAATDGNATAQSQRRAN